MSMSHSLMLHHHRTSLFSGPKGDKKIDTKRLFRTTSMIGKWGCKSELWASLVTVAKLPPPPPPPPPHPPPPITPILPFADIDEQYSSGNAGFSTLDEYYTWASSINYVHNVGMPTTTMLRLILLFCPRRGFSSGLVLFSNCRVII